MNNLRHIEALQQAALDLESQIRANGRYTADFSALDKALRRGTKSGFAFLIDEDGNAETIPLGEKAGEVEVTKGAEPGHFTVAYGGGFEGWKQEPKTVKEHQHIEEGLAYRQINEHEFAGMAQESHKRADAAKGRFPPQVHEGPKPATADAARRVAMTADAKREYREGVARSERIFAAMKERSAQIHK